MRLRPSTGRDHSKERIEHDQRDEAMWSVVTAGEWDTRHWRIVEDFRMDGFSEREAQAIADRECVEQFGDRPAEETK